MMSRGDDLLIDKLDLDTPDSVEYRMSWKAGLTEEEGTPIHVHNFALNYHGETEPFTIMAEADASHDQIEDLMAHGAVKMMARIVAKLERKGNRFSLDDLAKDPDLDSHRKEFAAILRDYKKSAKRRRTFTSGSIYYPGIEAPKKAAEDVVKASRVDPGTD